VTRLKGYDVLIRATALARERLPQIKTVIVGGTETSRQGYGEELQRLVGNSVWRRTSPSPAASAAWRRCTRAAMCGLANRDKPEAFAAPWWKRWPWSAR
jgi:hypothetical protein